MKMKKKRALKFFVPLVAGAAMIVFAGALLTVSVLNGRGAHAPRNEQAQTVPPTPEPVAVAPAPVEPPKPPVVVPDVHLPAVVGGVAPLVYRVATTQKVVFLGIDDGAYKDPEVIDLLKQNNIKASLYLSDLFIHSNPDFFKQVIATGSVVEDHSVSHDINMSKASLEYQKKEICGMADLDEKYYGHRPIFFRPPGGAYTLTTQQAAAACGMKAVVTWIAKANGGAMQYQVGNGLRAGDVVLMHFRPEFKQDLKAFVDAETAAGLHTELLEDWL